MATFAEYEPRLWRATERHHLPIAGAVELTYRCNFCCVHCYQQDARAQPELDATGWIGILDQLAVEGADPLGTPEIYRVATGTFEVLGA